MRITKELNVTFNRSQWTPLLDYLEVVYTLLNGECPNKFTNYDSEVLELLLNTFEVVGYNSQITTANQLLDLVKMVLDNPCRYSLRYKEEEDSDYLITYLTILSKLSDRYLSSLNSIRIAHKLRLHMGMRDTNLFPKYFIDWTDDKSYRIDKLLRTIEERVTLNPMRISGKARPSFLTESAIHKKVNDSVNTWYQAETDMLTRIKNPEDIINKITKLKVVDGLLVDRNFSVVNTETYLKCLIDGSKAYSDISYLVQYLQSNKNEGKAVWKPLISLARVAERNRNSSELTLNLLEFFVMYGVNIRGYLNKLYRR